MISLSLFYALAGCSGGDDALPVDTNPPPFGSDTGYGVPNVSGPSLDLTAVAAALEEGVRGIRDTDPVELLDVMEQLLNHQDPGSCPSYSETNNDYYDFGRPRENCTASSSALFQVDMRFRRNPARQDESVYRFEDGVIIGGSRIVDPDGNQMDFSLQFTHDDRIISTGNRKLDGSWFGVASWDGAVAGHWLGESLSMGFKYLWITGTDGVTPSGFTATGGVAGLVGPVVDSVVFQMPFGEEKVEGTLGFTLGTSAIGSQCEAEPYGSVNLRTHEGEWYTVRFEGPALGSAPDDAESCDGCGAVLYAGEDLGEVCVDMAMFLDWQGRPW